VWIETGPGGGLRARITAEKALGSGERVSLVLGTVDEVIEIVRSWLHGFVDGELG
jgi:hypothetical protein